MDPDLSALSARSARVVKAKLKPQLSLLPQLSVSDANKQQMDVVSELPPVQSSLQLSSRADLERSLLSAIRSKTITVESVLEFVPAAVQTAADPGRNWAVDTPDEVEHGANIGYFQLIDDTSYLTIFGQVGIRERLSLAVATCKSFRSLRTVKSLWETLDLTNLKVSGKGFVSAIITTATFCTAECKNCAKTGRHPHRCGSCRCFRPTASSV